MKRIIYKAGVISLLLTVTGWQGAYAEGGASEMTSEAFIKLIWHDHIFVYALFCGFVSILVKIVDYVIANQIDKTNTKTPQEEIMEQAMPLLGWFVSAAIVGYLAAIAGFFTTSPQTAVMVGLGWPMVYVRLKTFMEEKYQQKLAPAQPAQPAKNLAKDSGKP